MNNALSYWQGRTDGTTTENLRWHQIVQEADFNTSFNHEFVITGFCCDEGIQRNKGRIGAKEAPNALRKVLSNFPAHQKSKVVDTGNIVCDDADLEKAQENLTQHLSKIYQNQGKTLVLGGGHEVTYPHYKALQNHYPNYTVGVINFDAHFDNRKVEANIGATSGTGFYQIAEEGTINSLHIGISKDSNTQALFNYAQEKNMQYILLDDFHIGSPKVNEQIQNFIDSVNYIYVTVCMDVFSSAFAPGVSATAYNGLIPDAYFNKVFNTIISSPKLKAFDVAEVNPSLDIDNRTVKLAASLIYKIIMKS